MYPAIEVIIQLLYTLYTGLHWQICKSSNDMTAVSRVEIEHLFCCVFRLRHCVQSTVAQNWCYGRGSYMLYRLIRYLCIFAACMSPALMEVFHYSASNTVKWSNCTMVQFLTGTATNYFGKINCHALIQDSLPGLVTDENCYHHILALLEGQEQHS